MIKIFGRNNSINVQKVLWTASELNLSFERFDYGGKFGKLDTSEFKALNPNKLVPVLIDGETVLWESNAICRYIETCYSINSAGLWRPYEIRERAYIDMMMDWSSVTLYPSVRMIFFSLVRTAEKDRDLSALSIAKVDAKKKFRILDEILDGKPYIAGKHFTLADIAVGISAHRWIALLEENETKQLTNVLDWYTKRIRPRIGFIKHVIDIPLT